MLDFSHVQSIKIQMKGTNKTTLVKENRWVFSMGKYVDIWVKWIRPVEQYLKKMRSLVMCIQISNYNFVYQK